MSDGTKIYDLTGKVAVIAGGGGALGSSIACGLAQAGAQCAVTNVTLDKAEYVASQLAEACGHAKGYELDVADEKATEALCEEIYREFGKVDILVNCVGGNLKDATTSPEQSFFDLPLDALRQVMELNFMSSVVKPCQVFGKGMLDNPNGGSIINISSMSAIRPLTRIVGYSAAKAAVNNFTEWLAVYFAKELGKKIRVNAIAPGFFLTAQNQFLLTNDRTGELTDRGKTIIGHTPMGDFGVGEDLIGAALWLASDASRFVTGICVPVDGGFSAFSGV
ncbi:MAG: SDR family oxidoreductase [Candidatus Hydrogenedentes bacterium]|nr:SDR family oxidoreductase [Candidatus Hydrogenedentota bacterium]